VARTGLPPYPAQVRPHFLAADGRATPRGHAVNVQPHGRPSIAARGLGQGERPAPLRGAGTRLP